MFSQIYSWFAVGLEASEEVGKHVDKRRALAWFLGLTLPFALSCSVLLVWRESIVPNPGPAESAIRLTLIGIGFVMIFTVLYHVIIKPAISDYETKLRSDLIDHSDTQSDALDA